MNWNRDLVRLINLRKNPAPLRDLLKWLATNPEATPITATLRQNEWLEFYQAQHNGELPRERILEYTRFEEAVVSSPGPINVFLSWEHVVPDGDLSFNAKIQNLYIQRHGEFAITDREISRVEVSEPISAKVTIRRCKIAELILHSNTSCELMIENCWIGKIFLDIGTVKALTIHRSGILSIACPPADKGNPFAGPVVIDDLYTPRDEFDDLVDVQQLRDLRAHLLKLGNYGAAAPFHSAELALERKDQSLVERVWSWLYEVVSDFGASAGRALLWFFVCYAAMVLIALWGDPLEVGKDPYGWQIYLITSDWGARVLRALTYPFFAIFNPLGIFGARPILSPNSPLYAVVLTGLGLFALLALGLTIVSLRRRFKLS